MKKYMIRKLFAVVFVLFNFGYANVIDYTQFSSIEEVIEFETSMISKIPNSNYEQLSDIYVTRGESYILCQRFEDALDDFQKSYNFFLLTGNKNWALLFRCLFGQAIVYGHHDKQEMFFSIIEILEELIEFFPCSSGCNSDEGPIDFNPLSRHLSFCSDVPIFGPDYISIRDCLDFIDNTVFLMKEIVDFVPTKVAKTTLNFLVERLAKKARKCCIDGGSWKGCVQKICNKFHLWNQNWKLGVLPDPNQGED